MRKSSYELVKIIENGSAKTFIYRPKDTTMEKSEKRLIIEEITVLQKRAQEIAFFNYDEMGFDDSMSIADKAIFCLMVAAKERGAL